MKNREPHRNDALRLTQMMSLDFSGPKLWEPEELGAILEHQFATPLQDDLGGLDKGLAERLEEFNSSASRPIRSFRDLLLHPKPPVELLELTKQFAKTCRSHPDSPLPDEIATVLYFLSIAVAMTNCRRRITGMDDQSLRYSLDWALAQPWLEESMRRLLRVGRAALGSSAPPV